jgi:uncharacterized protein (TIGR03083 family)
MSMTHHVWMDTAAAEYLQIDRLLGRLRPDEWTLLTDCPPWTVRDMVAHLLGAAEATAGSHERWHQLWTGVRQRRRGQLLIDAMNAGQVAERSNWPSDQLRHALSDAGQRSVRARRRVPAPIRALRLPLGRPLGFSTLGNLLDRIYTRDAWMHRIDIARATDRRVALTPEHDGRIVADAVDEWAAQHGEPVTLDLTGPAGGHWTQGFGGTSLSMDAVEFCRTLSGREQATGLLQHQLAF